MKLQKGSEPLGISIVSGEKGGVYVSKVTGGSIAHQAGLEYSAHKHPARSGERVWSHVSKPL